MDAVSICMVMWCVWLLVWFVWAFQSKKTKERESRLHRVLYIVVAWAAMFLILSPKASYGWLGMDVFPRHSWIGPAGIALCAAGFALTFWARYILGANWSGNVTIKVGHELIRSGPYRWVRHPIYTGLMVAMAGTALARDQWRGLPALALLWLSFTFKRLKEERFMRQTFGGQYLEYSKTTGAIFPSLLRGHD
jgi:protein-S-isoprenylcysteine O-methyltransferase Ste14